MPTNLRRENIFIERFLSSYEDFSWANAGIRWLDQETDGAVEALATRADCRTLAIEHTIIEPFVADKEDFAFFKNVFLGIEEDKSLRVPGAWVQVLIPVGTLHGQRERAIRDAMAEGVLRWLQANRLFIPEGFSEWRVTIHISGGNSFEMTIYAKVVPVPGSGLLSVRRQQIDDNLDEVMEKAVTRKVPKLVRTKADKHLLMLERQHMNLFPNRMLEEIEKLKPYLPDLALVDEVWIIETMFYEREGYLRFERFENGVLASFFNFTGVALFDKLENGILTVGNKSQKD